jgi:hypothetical protein
MFETMGGEIKKSESNEEILSVSDELKEFTKEEFVEERGILAKDLRTIRKDYFVRKENLSEELNSYIEAIGSKQEELDKLKEELIGLELEINDKSSSLFNKLLSWRHLKNLEEVLIFKKDKQGVLEKEIQNLLGFQSEILSQLNNKTELDSAKNKLQDFYKNKIDIWRIEKDRNQEEERVENLERLEKEERERQIGKLSIDHKTIFVHGILDEYAPGENSLIKKEVSFEHKLKLMLSLEPTISTSSLQSGDSKGAMWAGQGVILGQGRVEAACAFDAETKSMVKGHRALGFAKSSIEEVHKAIPGISSEKHNEIIVSNPKVIGLYYSLIPKENYLTNQVSVEEIIRLGEELNLPVYGIKGGEAYEVIVNEKGEVKPGRKLDYSRIKDSVRDFSDEQKNRMLGEVLEERMPFKVEDMFKEARLLASMLNGKYLFLKFLSGEAKKLKSLKSDSGDLKIDEEKDKIDEIVYPDGDKIIFFRSQGILYEKKWDSHHNTFGNLLRVKSPEGRYINTALNTEDLGRNLLNPLDYLEGMMVKLEEWLNREKDFDLEATERWREIIDRLVFHLYGFAEMADKFGKKEISEKILEVAEKYKPKEEISSLVKRRINEDGAFKLSREDLT